MSYKDTCTECQGKGCFECANTGDEWIEDIHEEEGETGGSESKETAI